MSEKAVEKSKQEGGDLKGFYNMLKTNNLWNLSTTGVNGVKATMTMLSTKNGMYARIPMYCKGEACPYATTCHLLPFGMCEIGKACPTEVAQVQARYFRYAKEFELDREDVSFTDENLVVELITLEIYMERCKALMAIEGNPVQQILAGISENGTEIYQPAVSKAWDAYKDFSKKRDNNYQLLMATRKDKKSIKGEKMETATDFLEEVENIPDFYDVQTENPDGSGDPISAEPDSQNSAKNRTDINKMEGR